MSSSEFSVNITVILILTVNVRLTSALPQEYVF